jgi:hypothetical protein
MTDKWLLNARTALIEKHSRAAFYNTKAIDSILRDLPGSRLVALFKDYLVFDDSSCEFLKRSYEIDEVHERLPKLIEFYKDYSEIFPSYALLLQPT